MAHLNKNSLTPARKANVKKLMSLIYLNFTNTRAIP